VSGKVTFETNVDAKGEVKVRKLSETFKKASENAKGSQKSNANFTASLLKSQLIITGVTKTIDFFINSIKASVGAMDEQTKAARSVALVAEEFTRLKHVADQSGVANETLTRSLSEINREITTGGPKLKKFGIDIENLSNKNSSEVLSEIAKRTKEFGENSAEAAAMTRELFGERGRTMMSLLLSDVEALKDEADQLNLTFSKFGGEQSEAILDAFSRMKKASAGVGIAIFDAFANTPAFEMFLDFVDLGVENLAKMARFLAETVSKSIENVLALIQKFAPQIAGASEAFSVLYKIGKATNNLVIDLISIQFKSVKRIIDMAFTGLKAAGKFLTLDFKGGIEESRKALSNIGETTKDNVAILSKFGTSALSAVTEFGDKYFQTQDAILDYTDKAIQKSIDKKKKSSEQLIKIERETQAKIEAKTVGKESKFAGKSTEDIMREIQDIEQKFRQDLINDSTIDAQERLNLLAISHDVELMQLESWYAKQRELYAGHEEQMNQIKVLATLREQEIDKKRADAEKKISNELITQKQRETQDKLSAASNALSGLSGLFGKNKALSKGEALISGLVAQMNAARIQPYLPVGLGASIKAGAETIKTVRTIDNVKAAAGAYISRPTSVFMGEGGAPEAVLNPRATRAIGGREAVESLNRGGSVGGGTVVNINITASILDESFVNMTLIPAIERVTKR
jgi:hypothetical protein